MRKKSRRKAAHTNNDRVRDIYREYLLFIQKQGVFISDETTSEEALIASKQLFDSDEADALRSLYIRARYNDENQLSNDEVRRAKELWNAIRKEYEVERGDGSLVPPSASHRCSIKIIGWAVQNGVLAMYIPKVSSLSSMRTTDSGEIPGNSSFTLLMTIAGFSLASRV